MEKFIRIAILTLGFFLSLSCGGRQLEKSVENKEWLLRGSSNWWTHWGAEIPADIVRNSGFGSDVCGSCFKGRYFGLVPEEYIVGIVSSVGKRTPKRRG